MNIRKDCIKIEMRFILRDFKVENIFVGFFLMIVLYLVVYIMNNKMIVG